MEYSQTRATPRGKQEMPYSQREALLVTALELQAEFTMGDLVDAVWKRFPDKFRLKGYDLPHNGYVESKVYGSTGFVYRGQFEQLPGTRVFRLTKEGKRVGELLKSQGVTGARSKGTAPVAVENPKPLPPRRPLWANHL